MKYKTQTKQIKAISLITILVILLGSLQANARKITLRVGDTPPPINAFKWIKGQPVTEFEKGKVYVVEFGATWCKPCTAIIPRLTNLSRKYRSKAKVISIFIMEMNREPLDTPNPKYVQKVEKYVEEKSNRMKYTIAVDDPHKTIENTWHKAAGLGGVPKVFLIDKQGRIAYIGSYSREFEALVDDVVNDRHSMEELIKKAREEEAKVTPYDKTQPLLIDGNGGADTAFMFRSLLAKFKGDIKAGGSEFIIGNRNMVQEVGIWLSRLYMLAYGDTLFPYPMYYPNSYGKYWKKPILELSDTSQFVFDYKKPDNRWNYSLIVPEKRSAKDLQKLMRRDLKNYFGYEVSVETRKMPAWVLTATKKAKKTLKAKNPGQEYSAKTSDLMVTTMTNTNIRNIIYLLWGKNQMEPPFIDNTGIEGEFDIEFTGDVKKLEDMIEGLKENGLILKKGTWDMKVVVIRDPKE